MKDIDKISAKAGVNAEISTPLTLPNIKVGASVNPTMERNADNKHQLSPNVTNGNANVFPNIKSQGTLVPDFVTKKTGTWETDAHKAIAGSILSVAESMEKGGFLYQKN